MADKPIQELSGTTIIDAVRDFARADIFDVPQIERQFFSHVADAALRRTLVETLWGARWIYKLGLALLVQDEEQMAHVRCQVIDYRSVCEGLLHDLRKERNSVHLRTRTYQAFIGTSRDAYQTLLDTVRCPAASRLSAAALISELHAPR
jgi:hypothetical protein